MSTTATTRGETPSSSAPSPSQTRSSSDTATLYLFTFLATILILVLLSASLVLRSYILRRRYRQRFQQALADGLFAPLDDATGTFVVSAGFRRTTRRLGPKPVVFDTWIRPADDLVWSAITPVALRRTPQPPSTASSPRPSSPLPRPTLLTQLRFPSPRLSPRPSPPPPPRHIQGASTPTLARSPPPDPSTCSDEATLAVCVLVAMPDASSPVHRPNSKGKGVDPLEAHGHGDKDLLLPPHVRDADGLPLLEFGVVALTGEWT